jgi:hypothetical protein
VSPLLASRATPPRVRERVTCARSSEADAAGRLEPADLCSPGLVKGLTRGTPPRPLNQVPGLRRPHSACPCARNGNWMMATRACMPRGRKTSLNYQFIARLIFWNT